MKEYQLKRATECEYVRIWAINEHWITSSKWNSSTRRICYLRSVFKWMLNVVDTGGDVAKT